MQIHSVAYVGLETPDLDGWEHLCRRLLACQTTRFQADDGVPGMALRLDQKAQRVLLRESARPGDAFIGMELADASALAGAQAELEAHGVTVHTGTAAELALRHVDGMIHFADPAGYRLELCHGLHDAATPFAAPRPMGGFRTGEMGFGHAVLVVPDFDKARDFYCEVLGFRVSDYILTPTRRVFLHCNGRHHSIALAERKGFGIAHLMFEVLQFDDLGRAYDVALADYPERIFSTLGRHSNDHVTSFYIQTPAGVPIEYGWGGRTVDDATWQVGELFGPSLWGHDRVGQPADARAAADQQREFAFGEGLSAPIHVVAGSPAFDQNA